MMLRIWIAALAMMVMVGTAVQSSAEDAAEGLLGMLDPASCSDESERRAIEVEAKRVVAIADLCEATTSERLFSSELSSLDRGCDAMETSFVTSYAALLADPEKTEFTCEDIRALLSTVNKAFQDAMNE